MQRGQAAVSGEPSVLELDQHGAARDAVALRDVDLAHRASYGAVSGVSIFIASSTTSGWRA